MIVINPLANKKKVRNIVNVISSALSKRQVDFIAFTESWPQEINIYKEVWVIGGDGTLNYFLNFYNNITIPIVIFKGGTGNDFAWKLYGNVSVNAQIVKVLGAKPQSVDAAECNGRKFINGVGIGFDGEV